MAFNVILGCLVSSVKYKSRSDGRARKSKMIAGRIVHTVSISWASIRNRLMCLFVIIIISA